LNGFDSLDDSNTGEPLREKKKNYRWRGDQEPLCRESKRIFRKVLSLPKKEMPKKRAEKGRPKKGKNDLLKKTFWATREENELTLRYRRGGRASFSKGRGKKGPEPYLKGESTQRLST